jgi:hypothetical protein
MCHRLSRGKYGRTLSTSGLYNILVTVERGMQKAQQIVDGLQDNPEIKDIGMP